ncbi:MAG TPA: peptide-methionine (S)-S-oxide reductase MsrA [Gemmatimonadaceae bacterium]|nr:peptide-methionine (S)-S-oxide reductase MsrA [Gemmatimonadaceae bacterium]
MLALLSRAALAAALVAPVSAAARTGAAPNAASAMMVPAPAPAARDTAVFAGGCFWGIEAVFEHVKGVESATAGYAGGSTANPTYEEVSSGRTGHAESVRVVFDPSAVSYGTLLQVFFSVGLDPTQKDRQGPDVGTQYRSILFYRNAAQQKMASAYIEQLTRARTFPRPIVTEVQPLRAFYPAEAYHQHYAMLHPDQPYIAINDLPKVDRLRREFPALYREPATSQTLGSSSPSTHTE